MPNPIKPFRLQHPVIDYLRVAVFAFIILITMFVLKKFGNRTDDKSEMIQGGNEVVSLIDLN